MGPIFASAPGMPPHIRPQNGLTPLEVMLSKPIRFIRENMPASSTLEDTDLFENDAKRRKVMSLSEYYARKLGKFFEEPTHLIKASVEEVKPAQKQNRATQDKNIAIEFFVPGPEDTHKTLEVVSIPPPGETPESEVTGQNAVSTSTQTPLDGTTEVDSSLPLRPRKRSSEPDNADAETASKRARIVVGDEAASSATASQRVATKETPKASAKATLATDNSEAVTKKRKRDEATNSEKGNSFWREFPEKFKLARAKGIPNKGMFCYRNATIQALVHVPEIYDFLVNHHTMDKCKRKLPTCICCLLSIFARNHFDGDKNITNKLRALEQIDKLLGGDFAKTGSRHEQQDADEYALRVLDKAVEQLKSGDKNARTPLEELLEITTAQSVICRNQQCKHRSLTKSQSTSVRAKLPKGQTTVTLDEMIKNLSSSEPIKDYKCEKCGKLGATIRRRFTELPAALLVHINRGGKTNFRGQSMKLNSWVKFDPEIEIETGDGVSHKYILRSVVSHIGTSLNSGHYICFARNPAQATWAECNDSVVSQTSDAIVRGTNDRPRFSAYLLMYAKA
ncbi:hypothetical protein DFH27DRAFT_77484 [Peziza echinospora]|nr:hypothetical protein DFH27DRAFT_77484 [Peziza echinospora]